VRERIYCRIPGCTRSMFVETAIKRWGTPHVGMICGKHWRRLSLRERAVVHRMRRKMRRFGDEAVPRERWERVWKALRRRMADPRRIGRELGL
jgi:hypothetical protein